MILHHSLPFLLRYTAPLATLGLHGALQVMMTMVIELTVTEDHGNRGSLVIVVRRGKSANAVLYSRSILTIYCISPMAGQ